MDCSVGVLTKLETGHAFVYLKTGVSNVSSGQGHFVRVPGGWMSLPREGNESDECDITGVLSLVLGSRYKVRGEAFN